MKQLTIRLSGEAAQDLSKQARAAGIPLAAMARSLIVRGLQSPANTAGLLLAALRAASMAAAMAEIAACRGADRAEADRLLDAGAEKASKKFSGYQEMFLINDDGGDL